jgi:hypothetical protein
MVWCPAGVLAVGIPRDSIDYALSCNPHVIAIDAGSTDQGPYYLETASTYRAKSSIKQDMQLLLEARDTLAVPLIIGSCGTCGCDAMVDYFKSVCLEIAEEKGFFFALATPYSEQSVVKVVDCCRRRRIDPLTPVVPVNESVIQSCEHIVGLMVLSHSSE